MPDMLADHLRQNAATPGVETAVVASALPLTVDVGGKAVPAVDSTGGAAIIGGDVVHVVTRAGVRHITGVVTAHPTRGTVVAVGSGQATVSTSAGTVALAYLGGAPAVNSLVAIIYTSAGSYIAGTLSTSTPTQPSPVPVSAMPPLPSAPPATPIHDLVARPDTVTTAIGASWATTSDQATAAEQGHLAGTASAGACGFFFYGSPFAGASGRTCLAASVHLRRTAAIGAATAIVPHLQLHAGTVQAGTPPALVGSSTAGPAMLPGAETDVALPTVWGQQLLDGTAAGLALVYAGTADYARWDGIVALAAAGQITLTIQEG